MVVHGANVIRKRIKALEKELSKAEPAIVSYIAGGIAQLEWVIEDDFDEIKAENKAAVAEDAAAEIKAAEDLIAQEAAERPEHDGPPLETFEDPAKDPEPQPASKDEEVIG